MITTVGQITLIDLVGQMERKEITVNKNYQRGFGLWPDSARTYFIDTILEGYPFPKIYLYQIFNEKSKRPIKEIVDGQQRVSTIIDFISNKFSLTSASKNFSRMKYCDLDDELQKRFMSYQIDTSTILSATRPELLEMFRRINAYTAPLTAPEKRHAKYQGPFKWMIVELADEFSPILEKLKIFTPKQLARMQDAEFISDLVLALEKGITSKSSKAIDSLYREHEEEFDDNNHCTKIIGEFFRFLDFDLVPLHGTFLMKSYVVHSLFCAFAQTKYGLPKGQEITGVRPNSNIVWNMDSIIPKLESVTSAHEYQYEDGEHKEYVKACLSSTTKSPQRTIRFKILTSILAG